MGPPSGASRCRNFKCLLCRGDVDSNSSSAHNQKSKNRCAISLCTIFGLPEKHPFKFIYENAHYCRECFNEVKEADVTLGKLEILKQSLLRFQDQVYSKLGDNYFQIENRDEFAVSYREFENGGDAVRGKKFTYDEIIKIIYEKLDQECLKWERFSSENPLYNDSDREKEVEVVVPKADACCQTNNDVIIVEAISEANINCATASIVHSAGEAVILPNVNDHDQTGTASWNFDAGNDDSMIESSACADPLESSTVRFTTTSVEYQPTSIAAVIVPDLFTQPPTNFEKTISCTYDPENCNKTFYDEYNLKVHIRSFHEGNPRPHVCMSCDKAFTEEGRLKTHFLRVHAEGGSYMCEHCGKGFAQPSLLKDHLRKMHRNKQEGACPCPFCGANFETRKDMTDHEALHRTKASPFDCVYCDEPQPNSTVAKEHYLTKHSESIFRCDQCFKVLSSSASLCSHMKLHTGRFQCDECPYVGSSKSALKCHKMSHSNEKPHKCGICGAAYKYTKNLTAHMRLHTGEKPYVCNFCGAAFREHSYLKRHEESHASECLYECTEDGCVKKFKTKESLKKHHRAVHLGIKRKRTPKASREGTGSTSFRMKKKKRVATSPVKNEDHEEEVIRISRRSPSHKLKYKSKEVMKDRSPSRKKLRRRVRGMKNVTPKKAIRNGDEAETQKYEQGDVEQVGMPEGEDQHELNNAVASIEVPTTSSLFPNATIVYTNEEYEIQQPGAYEIVPISSPVTVVSTPQGVNLIRTNATPGGRVQLRMEYKYT